MAEVLAEALVFETFYFIYINFLNQSNISFVTIICYRSCLSCCQYSSPPFVVFDHHLWDFSSISPAPPFPHTCFSLFSNDMPHDWFFLPGYEMYEEDGIVAIQKQLKTLPQPNYILLRYLWYAILNRSKACYNN